MGHSASMAKKYSPRPSPGNNEENDDQDERDSLATVSSYRPTSPLAHSDAQQFSFGTPQDRPPSRHGYQMNGTVPNGSVGYRRNVPKSSSSLGTHQLRSMRDVNHFLVRNPELLSRRHAKSASRKSEFDDIEARKQIKTKQNLYLGFFDPPTVYGKGVDPDKQLKINQRVYLQLIHPTYGQQYYKPYRPLVPNNMIVVRKEGNTTKPPHERTRPPLKGMEVTRASPVSLMTPQRQSPTRQHLLLEANQRSSSQRKSPHIPNGHVLPSSTPVREVSVRRTNDYIDMPDVQPPSVKMKKQSSKGFSKLNPDLMEVERRFETANSLERSSKDEDIVFDYSIDELGLKKKTRGSKQTLPQDTRGSVEPLYFRKSLAYNPKYSSRGNVLSDPL